jgi:AcrR family transcriptional regulator
MRLKTDTDRPLRSVARPKQARSEESLRRLLDAAESLIGERGFGEMSIADIARRARSSVGGFYARFRDKDELLLALHERFVETLELKFAQIEAELDDTAELTQLVSPSIHMLVEVYRQQRPLLSAFMARASDNRRIFQAGVAFRNGVVARFTKLILRWKTRIMHPDPELAAELAVQLALSFMDQTIHVGKLRVAGEVLPEGRIEEELARALLSYLNVSTGP